MKSFSYCLMLLFATMFFSCQDEQAKPADVGKFETSIVKKITELGGHIIQTQDLPGGGVAWEAVFPKRIKGRGPSSNVNLYDAGGYAIGTSNSRMLYRGIKIMNGLSDQNFMVTSPIELAEAGVVDPDGPQDATGHMSASYNSIYGATNPPTFCLDIEAFLSEGFYNYLGALAVENIPGDLISGVYIRYEFSTLNYSQTWDPVEVEEIEIEECDGFSPGLSGGGSGGNP